MFDARQCWLVIGKYGFWIDIFMVTRMVTLIIRMNNMNDMMIMIKTIKMIMIVIEIIKFMDEPGTSSFSRDFWTRA